MIGSLIGAGLSAIGGIAGGIAKSKAMQNVKNNLEGQRQANEDWYDRRYNESATERADARAAIERARAAYLEGNRQAAGAAAVTGGSEEGVAAAKAANAKALGGVMTQIAADGSRRKDAIESQYMSKDEALQQQLNDMEMAKASNINQAIGGVAQAGANFAELDKYEK